MRKEEFFPDGTPIDQWFYEAETPNIAALGKQYLITDYGVKSDGGVYTEKLQNLIDEVAQKGGGVLIVPNGTYCSGALFFKQGVHLCIQKGGVLLASDDVCDYPICKTRIEGESCDYLPAFINADGVDGFTLFGEGTIDGNGLRAWKAFWHRRKWNPACTNKDEQRPRLVFISNSSNVTVSGLRMQNSPFWTNHIYKCKYVKYLGCDIFSPHQPVAAPSTDGLDLDVCTDVLVKNCRFQVCDDGIALKGGKGPWADTLPENGANERILIEDCLFKPCCAVLTCGSESIHNRNILVRRIEMDGPGFALWLKMRPDTPQKYEYITFDEVNGFVGSYLYVKPWTQFFDLKDRADIPMSYAQNIAMKNANCKCHCFFNVEADKTQYQLSNITIENISVLTKADGFTAENQEGFVLKNIQITKWIEES